MADGKIKKTIGKIALTAFFLSLAGLPVKGSQIDEKTEIKHGTRREHIEEKFGAPEIITEIDRGFFGIPRERALYRIGESEHLILDYFSKRVRGVEILIGMDMREAKAVFFREERSELPE